MSLDLTAIAQKEVDATLSRLPRHLQQAAQSVAIQLQDFPDEDSDLENDLLGVFSGNTYAELEGGQADATPTEIILFLKNIWDYAEEKESTFRDEVRITLLHELGHFLGLDEIDLEARGLD